MISIGTIISTSGIICAIIIVVAIRSWYVHDALCDSYYISSVLLFFIHITILTFLLFTIAEHLHRGDPDSKDSLDILRSMRPPYASK